MMNSPSSIPDDEDLPEEEDFINRQLDIFREFLCNNPAERDKLSNTIELWDSIPRYSVSRRQQAEIRKRPENKGTLPIHTLQFKYRGEPFTVKIRPAMIEEVKTDKNKKVIRDEHGDAVVETVTYYPSGREELIEEALRKIATRQSYGFIRKEPKAASGVTFSLNELCQELSSRGHALSYHEVVQGLNIMRYSSIDIFRTDDETTGRVSSNYLPVLVSISKRQIENDPSSRWIVHFHPFITQGIEALAYRQFNYDKMMSLTTQLCRWIHKYLCIKFTQASLTLPPFELHYKTIKRDSGLLNCSRERDNWCEVANAMRELEEKGVLSSWRESKTVGPRGKVEGIVYYLTPSMAFISEQKAANKRKSNAAAELLSLKKS